jgi:cytochrome c
VEERSMKHLRLFALTIASVVATTSLSAQYIRLWSPTEAAKVAGRQLFLDHCAACHLPQPGASGALAPSLVGVVGRPAGTVHGFPYSEALKKSGIVWTEENLRKWIADNKHMVPDTLMPHASLSDPAEQYYVVEYLKTLQQTPR